MSAWPGKYVIGLTGNIATGKSEVRKMLERLGAFGIDADALAHLVIQKGEPAYEAILNAFGKNLISSDGEIDRTRLGVIVFSNPDDLSKLERIVHPEVRKRVFEMVRHAGSPIVVIEAIKLLENGYPELCDSIWVTTSEAAVQLHRLMNQRGMTEALATQRIAAQPAQETKVGAADVVIVNNSALEDVWKQVEDNWKIISANRVGGS